MVWRCIQLSSLAALLGVACIDIGEIRPPGSGSEFTRLGAVCIENANCAGGRCVDGFCCKVTACPVCQKCGKTGQCAPVAPGDREPHGRCDPAEPAEICSKSGTCDSLAKCAVQPQGYVCDSGSCRGDVVVNASACDGFGRCVSGTTIACAPFACDYGQCNEQCDSDADCVDGKPCVSGSCGKRVNGGRCVANDQCESGFCADGFCCNEACTGPCTSCSQPKSEGKCVPVAMGANDPHRKCLPDLVMTCRFTGTCDGAGACQYHGRGAICMRACTGGGYSLITLRCDGVGTCGPNAEISVCPTNACVTDPPSCR